MTKLRKDLRKSWTSWIYGRTTSPLSIPQQTYTFNSSGPQSSATILIINSTPLNFKDQLYVPYTSEANPLPVDPTTAIPPTLEPCLRTQTIALSTVNKAAVVHHHSNGHLHAKEEDQPLLLTTFNTVPQNNDQMPTSPSSI